MQQLVTVYFSYLGSCVVVVGDICGVLGENIAHYLIYGIISLFLQRVIDTL